MDVVKRISRMREVSRSVRSEGKKIGLVATMGALHEGHLSLVRRARQLSEIVVMSVFVNPTQFAEGEDYDTYPRDLTRDVDLATKEGVDYVFAPAPAEMYPDGFRTFVEVQGLSGVLCGESRPGHFRGVTTVVMKLLQIVSPDVAVFGSKDFQQAVIIRRMAKDLNLGVEIHTAPIVREPDGLALSSRNRALTAAQRKAAVVLSRSLEEAARVSEEGEREAAAIVAKVREMIEAEEEARVDYVAVVDPDTLGAVERIRKKALVAIAVFFGPTRLIDNTLLEVKED